MRAANWATRVDADFDRYTAEGILLECGGLSTPLTPRGGRRHLRSSSLGKGLFEARGLTTGVRLFFVFAPGYRIVVLDGYLKKRTSIPARIMARIRRLQANTEEALRNEDGKNRQN